MMWPAAITGSWIRLLPWTGSGKNIRAFGGDPENITIFGQSAGCISVQTLLSTPYAKGKFAKAILQSGAGYPVVVQRDVTLDQAFEYGKMVAEKAGAASLEELRAVSMETLLAVQGEISEELMSTGQGLVFCPVLNRKFRTQTYDGAVENGTIANVPTMIGSTRNDITVTPEEAASQQSRFRESCRGWGAGHGKAGSCTVPMCITLSGACPETTPGHSIPQNCGICSAHRNGAGAR